MTEQEWLECDHHLCLALSMLPLLSSASKRKLRLFCCACCRYAWQLFDQRSRMAVEVAERYSDGLATKNALSQMRTGGGSALSSQSQKGTPAYIAWCSLRDNSFAGVQDMVGSYAAAVWKEGVRNPPPYVHYTQLANLLRDIFGNPFRPSLNLPLSVLAWNDSTVRRIAEGIYEERKLPEGTLKRPRLAILADALEEAGCDNADILSHLRRPGKHVRGCWVVDLVLEKE